MTVRYLKNLRNHQIISRCHLYICLCHCLYLSPFTFFCECQLNPGKTTNLSHSPCIHTWIIYSSAISSLRSWRISLYFLEVAITSGLSLTYRLLLQHSLNSINYGAMQIFRPFRLMQTIAECLQEHLTVSLSAITLTKNQPHTTIIHPSLTLLSAVFFIQTNCYSYSTDNLQRDPLSNYRAGFNECRGEITRYLATVDGIGIDWKMSLLEHLATCCHAPAAGSAVMKTPLGVPCLPNMPKGLNHPSLLQPKQEHSAQFRMTSANNLANAKIATILVPTSASPFLMTTSQPSGYQNHIPVLCKNPMETRSTGVAPEAPVNSSLWRPFW